MIETKNYYVGYEKDILENLNFTAKEGEMTVLMGPNGVGKTTLLKSIVGLIPHRGEIKTTGSISYLNQEIFNDNSFTVFETVLLGKVENLRLKVQDEDVEEVNEMLEMLNIKKFSDRKLNNLSGGERQKVFIAQALLKNPKVLLLDEPTSSLDIKNQYEILDIISKLTKKRNLTTLVSIHQMDLIERFGDNLIVLKDKKIFAQGTKEEVFCEEMFKEVYGLYAKIEKIEDRIMFYFNSEKI
ncbi:ABC transporter ATP-binding protein [Peptoniphilus stercorisuis]|uniref:Iron complex transport system ATP-binding protein n=1 Tax=Peptoniphilus stercorisuis TaxID=1436965 RepID=A0ABS4KDX5_9FIRM|nr:ABC transporter ATP-binding protein [Peptoniphilus stercorisuis]MBP2025605.1 iron complex transport system ATP-binding protein [Peptoniphilus stercorisuis]